VPARGSADFGWDAVFEAEDTGKTYEFIYLLYFGMLIPAYSYAEMIPEEKNGLSHRYRALAKLKEYLIALNQQ
jgi:inosine triphosphate pyrophosphatase